MTFLKELNKIERLSFRNHIVYNIVEGILFGVFLLNEFIFLKSLDGTEFQVGLLFLFSMAVFFPLIFFNEFLRRVQNKKKLIRITAIVSRAPLLLFFFFPSEINSENIVFFHYVFLGIFLIYYLGTPITLPTINLLLKAAYQNNNFGKLYGYATTVNKLFALIATFAFGQILDFNNYAFKYIYPALGILGIIGLFYLSNIPAVILKGEIKLKFMQSVKNSALRLLNILKTNKPFLHFQYSFFFYGLAFMITITVITFFMESHLNLNYASIATYKTIAGVITIIFLPIFGKALDKTDPRKFAGIGFIFLLIYVILVMLTQFFPYSIWIGNFELYWSLMFAFLFFGLFGATITLAWHIGSAFFTPNPNEASDYHAVHLILTGFRALFAPLTGVLLYSILGYTTTFSIAILFIIFAIVIIFWSKNKY